MAEQKGRKGRKGKTRPNLLTKKRIGVMVIYKFYLIFFGSKSLSRFSFANLCALRVEIF